MGALLKSKLVIAVAIVAALIGLYALLGFKVAPGFVRNKAIEYVRAEYGRELTLGEIRIHPVQAAVRGARHRVPRRGRRADAGSSSGCSSDFELSSLWKRALYFREVDVESPYVRAMIRPDGAMNLADLAPRTPPGNGGRRAAQGLDRGPRRSTDGVVDFLDRARSRPFERTLRSGRPSPCRTSRRRPRAATSG